MRTSFQQDHRSCQLGVHYPGGTSDLALRAEAGDPFAAQRLAELMAEQGNTKEAIALLRPFAYAGNKSAGAKMVELMATLGWIDDLDGEVAAGTQGAVEALRDAQKQSSR